MASPQLGNTANKPMASNYKDFLSKLNHTERAMVEQVREIRSRMPGLFTLDNGAQPNSLQLGLEAGRQVMQMASADDEAAADDTAVHNNLNVDGFRRETTSSNISLDHSSVQPHNLFSMPALESPELTFMNDAPLEDSFHGCERDDKHARIRSIGPGSDANQSLQQNSINVAHNQALAIQQRLLSKFAPRVNAERSIDTTSKQKIGTGEASMQLPPVVSEDSAGLFSDASKRLPKHGFQHTATSEDLHDDRMSKNGSVGRNVADDTPSPIVPTTDRRRLGHVKDSHRSDGVVSLKAWDGTRIKMEPSDRAFASPHNSVSLAYQPSVTSGGGIYSPGTKYQRPVYRTDANRSPKKSQAGTFKGFSTPILSPTPGSGRNDFNERLGSIWGGDSIVNSDNNATNHHLQQKPINHVRQHDDWTAADYSHNGETIASKYNASQAREDSATLDDFDRQWYKSRIAELRNKVQQQEADIQSQHAYIHRQTTAGTAIPGTEYVGHGQDARYIDKYRKDVTDVLTPHEKLAWQRDHPQMLQNQQMPAFNARDQHQYTEGYPTTAHNNATALPVYGHRPAFPISANHAIHPPKGYGAANSTHGHGVTFPAYDGASLFPPYIHGLAPPTYGVQNTSNRAASENIDADFIRRCFDIGLLAPGDPCTDRRTATSSENGLRAYGIYGQDGTPARPIRSVQHATNHDLQGLTASSSLDMKMHDLSKTMTKMHALAKFQRQQQDSDRLARIEAKISEFGSGKRTECSQEHTALEVDKLSQGLNQLAVQESNEQVAEQKIMDLKRDIENLTSVCSKIHSSISFAEEDIMSLRYVISSLKSTVELNANDKLRSENYHPASPVPYNAGWGASSVGESPNTTKNACNCWACVTGSPCPKSKSIERVFATHPRSSGWGASEADTASNGTGSFCIECGCYTDLKGGRCSGCKSDKLEIYRQDYGRSTKPSD